MLIWALALRPHIVFLTLFFIGFVGPSHADDKMSPQDFVWFDDLTGYAIAGYDPVAYFTRGEALLGDPNHQANIKGNAWKFYNIGNKEVFERHPDVYTPQFGGYDSYALSEDKLLKGFPTIWVMRDKKLYFFQNVINLRLWLDDPEMHIMKAKQHQDLLERATHNKIPIN